MNIADVLINKKSSEEQNSLSFFLDFINSNYLKKKLCFYKKDNAGNVYKMYAELFSSILTTSNDDFANILKYQSDSVFTQIKYLLEHSLQPVPLVVKSRSGHGKTEFLSVLYQYLLQQYQNNEFNRYPVFISLHYYNKLEYKNAKRFHKQARELLFADISPLFVHLREANINNILIIIDGPDEFRNPKIELETELLEMLRQELPDNIQIIGLRQYVDKHKIIYRSEKNFNGEIELQLNKLSVTSDCFNILIDRFSQIEKVLGFVNDKLALESYLKEKIKALSIQHIDMFHLFLLSKSFQYRSEYAGIRTLGSLYEKYIKQCNIDIDQISALAFKMYNLPVNITNDEKNTKIWWKLQKHDTLRDYLAAYFIANRLINYSNQDLSIFDFVYPYEINSFCKDIINEDVDSQEAAFNTIISLFDNSSQTARTHFCYLLGRFKDPHLRNRSMEFLLNEENKLFERAGGKIQIIKSNQSSSKPDRQFLLYYRTICISLICLGSSNISSKYIRQMLENKHIDNLNRGFHLEYYEDIVFPMTSQSQLLTHDDDLSDFPRTYQRLYNKISVALSQKEEYPLFQVELYTLCSLIQHRQEAGLNVDCIDTIIEVIENVNNSDFIICDELKLYLNLCSTFFRQKNYFKTGALIKELYFLKQVGRKGWIKRRLKKPETVASHIWGTLLLAYMYLPTVLNGYKEYDKDLIIRMLIIHDLGETYVGDLTPKEKTNEDKKLEEMSFKYMSLMGTYNSINCIDIDALFCAFTHHDDINSKIARELDKLDNLLQLYIYNVESPIKDFENFKSGLEKEIKTPIGIQIMKQISEMFIHQTMGLHLIMDKLITDVKKK